MPLSYLSFQDGNAGAVVAHHAMCESTVAERFRNSGLTCARDTLIWG